MKLWLLVRNEDTGWDETEGLVIVAETEQDARRMASEKPYRGDEPPESWMDSRRSSCEELKPDGVPRVVIRDFRAG